MHAYERVRQTGLLKRALLDWRNKNSPWKDWPIVLAGDFNDQPHSATYKLMTGAPLTLHNWQEVKSSAVVHKSVDDARERERVENAQEGEEEGDEEEEAEEEGEKGEDDQMIKNCRHALPEDGLLSFQELVQLHDLSLPAPLSSSSEQGDGKDLIGHQVEAGLVSAYGSCFGSLEESQEENFFGSSQRGRERFDDPNWTADTPNPHLGTCKEPMWTLHSSIFALTLDYIFLFPPSHPTITALLPTHTTSVLEPGVPRRGVCASDHIAIGAELRIPTSK
jgi:RNA exonuclease NGL2